MCVGGGGGGGGASQIILSRCVVVENYLWILGLFGSIPSPLVISIPLNAKMYSVCFSTTIRRSSKRRMVVESVGPSEMGGGGGG